MNRFDEEVQVFYDRYDKAIKKNDIKELAFFSQFCMEKDIRKWDGFRRRQMCENARTYEYWKKCGYTDFVLNEHGWLGFHCPGFEKQEFHPLGCLINRGCCNMQDSYGLGVMQLPNGKWIAECGWYPETLENRRYLYLSVFDEQYDTRAEAVNTAIKRFVDWWHCHYEDVKKEDEAVIKAKSMLIIDNAAPIPKMKGEPIQLSLF
jgi:hypothetical protein